MLSDKNITSDKGMGENSPVPSKVKRKSKADLDEFMSSCKNERTNQKKHCQDRTPMQTFQDGRPHNNTSLKTQKRRKNKSRKIY